MKKFNFRLEGLLKLRKFEEDKIKRELGGILKNISQTEVQIEEIEQSINEAYRSHDEFLAEASLGQMAQFFPRYIEGRRSDLEKKKELLSKLKRFYDMKLFELKQARGAVKVVDKMKERKLEEWKKDVTKKQQADIEDILNMKRNSNVENAG
jgi:flagellar protein FliJ